MEGVAGGAAEELVGEPEEEEGGGGEGEKEGGRELAADFVNLAGEDIFGEEGEGGAEEE